MPSATRFSFLPFVVAGSAAVGGVLGAFVAVGLVATPPPRDSGAKEPPGATQPAKPTPPETTGSAAAPQIAGTGSECESQTWPYLSRACMEEWQRKNRNVRVISTDKLDKPTLQSIESPQSAQPAAAPAPAQAAASANAYPLPVATSEPWFDPSKAGMPASAQQQQQQQQQPQSRPPVTAEDNSKPKSPGEDSAKAKLAGDEEPRAKAKQAAKAKRKPKAEPVPADEGNVADNSDNERNYNLRVDRRKPSRRVAEHGRDVGRDLDRDDDAPRGAYADSGGERRVVIIRRGGGPFERLFGMGRVGGDDDDD